MWDLTGTYFVNAPLTRNSTKSFLSFMGTELEGIFQHPLQLGRHCIRVRSMEWKKWCRPLFFPKLPIESSFFSLSSPYTDTQKTARPQRLKEPLVWIYLNPQVSEWKATQWISNSTATWARNKLSLLSHWEFGVIHIITKKRHWAVSDHGKCCHVIIFRL